MLRWLAILVAVGLLGQEPTFRSTVPVVLVPVTVQTKDGKYVDDLEPGDFTLLDEGKPQEIRVDPADAITAPLAVVIAVQANATSAAAALKIRKVGSMVEPLITGDRGHAALITFGSEVNLDQDFTRDGTLITRAFRQIRPDGGKAARMLDAITQGVEMLTARPSGERRVMIVLGESRDRGSQARFDTTLKAIQRLGVTVYSVTFSAYTTPFTTKAGELPMAGPFDLLALFTEPARLAKTNVAELVARESGGRRFSFTTLRGLETDLTALGEEVHSQYLLSYQIPAGGLEYHRIEVRIAGHPQAVVRARTGYWSR